MGLSGRKGESGGFGTTMVCSIVRRVIVVCYASSARRVGRESMRLWSIVRVFAIRLLYLSGAMPWWSQAFTATLNGMAFCIPMSYDADDRWMDVNVQNMGRKHSLERFS